MKPLVVAAAALSLFASSASCSKRSERAPATQVAGSVAAVSESTTKSAEPLDAAKPRVARPPAEKAAAGVGAVPPGTPRKIVQTGELRVTVQAYEPARAAIEKLVAEAQGFVASAEVRHVSDRVSSATLVLRIPNGRYGDVAARIGALGKVEYEASKADDVTEQYFDLAARLANAKKLEARLLHLLDTQAGKLTDVLQVERELARVREQVERFEGKLRVMDNLVSLSTLRLTLQIREPGVASAPTAFGDELQGDLEDEWRAFKRFGRGLVRGAVRQLPWLPVWALAGLGVYLVWRRIRRRRAEKK